MFVVHQPAIALSILWYALIDKRKTVLEISGYPLCEWVGRSRRHRTSPDANLHSDQSTAPSG